MARFGPALIAAVACAIAAFAAPVGAVDGPVEFGEPTVMSQQGQRLKVVVPVRSASDERASAASFLVRETEVPRGFQPPTAQSFTVMRPARADYVVLQSGDIVRSPDITLMVSVAGDPRSPYRMDLKVPPASASGDRLAMAGQSANRAGSRPGNGAGVGTRLLRGPAGESNLPPK